jgi:putative inorganic carbon (HCO3(-)) transporter
MVWKQAIELWRARPVTGYGPDQFYSAYNARFGAFTNEGRTAVYDKAHNEYFQVLVDSGILGFVAILALYALILREGVRRRRDPLQFAALFAVFCFMVQAFFNISTPFAHPIAWVLLGVASQKRDETEIST